MSKAPWFPLYAADFLNDEAAARMTDEEFGIYCRLLMFEWINGSVPAEPAHIAELLKAPCARIAPALRTVLVKFIKHPDQPGRLINKRLEKEREEQQKRAEARVELAKKAAKSRWYDPMREQSVRNADAMPTQCGRNAISQSQSQSQLTTTTTSATAAGKAGSLPSTSKKPKTSTRLTKDESKAVALPAFLPLEVWTAWVDHRYDAKHEPLTAYAVSLQLRDLEVWHRRGLDVVAIVQQAIKGSWQGLYLPREMQQPGTSHNQPRRGRERELTPDEREFVAADRTPPAVPPGTEREDLP